MSDFVELYKSKRNDDPQDFEDMDKVFINLVHEIAVKGTMDDLIELIYERSIEVTEGSIAFFEQLPTLDEIGVVSNERKNACKEAS